MSTTDAGSSVCPLAGAACGAAQPGRGNDAVMYDRRTMLTHAMLAAAAAALAACGVAGIPSAPESLSPFTLKVSDYPELASVGGVALVNHGGNPVAVVRTGAATFVALSRICPHQGGTIAPGFGGFYCPNHGAQFNSSGQWVGGQPTSSMRSYAASFDATAGTLTVG